MITGRCVDTVMRSWRQAVLPVLVAELPRRAVDFDREAAFRDAEVSVWEGGLVPFC